MSINKEESLLEFPCKFPVKVFGKNCDAFEIAVLNIITKHVPNLADDAITTKKSSDGNYLAITATFEAHSQEQLDNIYYELTACELVTMSL